MLPFFTDRLRLRRLEPGDAVRLAAYRSDPSVAIYQSWSDMTLADAQALIREQSERVIGEHDQWFQVAIADRESDVLLGDIGICVKSPGRVAEIGFTLSPDAHGKGYATEACRAVMDLIFSFCPVEMIEAVVDARNDAAIQLVKRLDMELVRTEQAEFKGEVCSEHHFIRKR